LNPPPPKKIPEYATDQTCRTKHLRQYCHVTNASNTSHCSVIHRNLVMAGQETRQQSVTDNCCHQNADNETLRDETLSTGKKEEEGRRNAPPPRPASLRSYRFSHGVSILRTERGGMLFHRPLTLTSPMFAVCNSQTVPQLAIPIQLVRLSAVANFHTLSLCMPVHFECNWEFAIANCQHMKGTT